MKTGSVPYELIDLSLNMDDDAFLPASALNELRRRAFEALGERRIADARVCDEAAKPLPPAGDPDADRPAGTRLRYFRLTNAGPAPADGRFAVSGLRIFGSGDGSAPEKAPDFTAERGSDAREMRVQWTAVPGAEGYIIRFGVNPDEPHIHWQVINETRATVRCLTAGVRYHVRVDAYNENGIARGTDVKTV